MPPKFLSEKVYLWVTFFFRYYCKALCTFFLCLLIIVHLVFQLVCNVLIYFEYALQTMTIRLLQLHLLQIQLLDWRDDEKSQSKIKTFCSGRLTVKILKVRRRKVFFKCLAKHKQNGWNTVRFLFSMFMFEKSEIRCNI